MKKTKMLFAFLLLTTIALMFTGCGDDSTPAATPAATPAGFVITTASPLASGTVGTAYVPVTLAATGGTAPLTWALATGSSLPAGLTLSTAGVISGTPTTAGTATFTVTVTDSTAKTASKALSITVTASGALTITTTTLPGATVGTAYSQTLAATGGTGTLSWTITGGSLAPLTLSSTGTITGTPIAAGTLSFTVTVTDSAATPVSDSQALSIAVSVAGAGAPLAITPITLPAATFGTAYGPVTLAATGGTSPYTWALAIGSAALPAGLTLSAGGVIAGTPTAPAVPNATTSNFTVRVTDAVLGTATTPLSITASLSASALLGKTIYDGPCAGCHSLGIYDTTGAPNLGVTTLAAINTRFSGGATHNGQTMNATQITNMFDFVSLY